MIIILQTYLNISCGITRIIELLLKNSTYSSEMIVLTYGGDNTKLLSSKGIQSYDNAFRLYLGLIKLLFSSKRNKVVVHSFHRSFDFFSFLLKKIFSRISTITSAQSKVWGKKIFSYKADLIIACSNAIKSHLINYFGTNQDKISVIYNFIDPQLIENSLDTKETIKIEGTKGRLIIGFVGRFDKEEKGIDILLKSFIKIFERNNDAALFFIGSGKDENIISKYKNTYDLPIYKVQAQDNVYTYLNKIDILVLPSRVEPFGIVIIEAGYMKKPVIASNVDGIPEIIDDGINGLLFTPEDHVDLSNKIISLINDKDKAKILGEKLHQKVINNFTADVIVPQYEKLYSSILGKK